MVQKPKFDAGMAFDKDNSLLLVFFFSCQIEVVLLLVVDQRIRINNQEQRICPFLRLLLQFLVNQFQILLVGTPAILGYLGYHGEAEPVVCSQSVKVEPFRKAFPVDFDCIFQWSDLFHTFPFSHS